LAMSFEQWWEGHYGNCDNDAINDYCKAVAKHAWLQSQSLQLEHEKQALRKLALKISDKIKK